MIGVQDQDLGKVLDSGWKSLVEVFGSEGEVGGGLGGKEI